MRVHLTAPRQTNLYVFLTRAGYHRSPDGRSYIRRFGRSNYPRLHLYVVKPSPLIVTLHLDQKAPSYPGSRRHAAEQESPLLTEETDRLRKLSERS